MKAYRHLFFDLDHTLWDFETNAHETLEQLFTEYDLARHGLFSRLPNSAPATAM